ILCILLAIPRLNPVTSSDPNILCRLVYLWLITREYRISLVGLIPCLIADGATSLLTADLNLEPHFNSMFDKKHREVLIFFMFLRLWCRISFRRALPPHSTPVVMRLNLPPPLKRFISMEHEVMKLLELERASFDKYEEEGTWEASLAVDSEEDIEHYSVSMSSVFAFRVASKIVFRNERDELNQMLFDDSNTKQFDVSGARDIYDQKEFGTPITDLVNDYGNCCLSGGDKVPREKGPDGVYGSEELASPPPPISPSKLTADQNLDVDPFPEEPLKAESVHAVSSPPVTHVVAAHSSEEDDEDEDNTKVTLDFSYSPCSPGGSAGEACPSYVPSSSSPPAQGGPETPPTSGQFHGYDENGSSNNNVSESLPNEPGLSSRKREYNGKPTSSAYSSSRKPPLLGHFPYPLPPQAWPPSHSFSYAFPFAPVHYGHAQYAFPYPAGATAHVRGAGRLRRRGLRAFKRGSNGGRGTNGAWQQPPPHRPPSTEDFSAKTAEVVTADLVKQSEVVIVERQQVAPQEGLKESSEVESVHAVNTEEGLKISTEQVLEMATEQALETPAIQQVVVSSPIQQVPKAHTEQVLEAPTEEVSKKPTKQALETATEQIPQIPTEQRLEMPDTEPETPQRTSEQQTSEAPDTEQAVEADSRHLHSEPKKPLAEKRASSVEKAAVLPRSGVAKKEAAVEKRAPSAEDASVLPRSGVASKEAAVEKRAPSAEDASVLPRSGVASKEAAVEKRAPSAEDASVLPRSGVASKEAAVEKRAPSAEDASVLPRSGVANVTVNSPERRRNSDTVPRTSEDHCESSGSALRSAPTAVEGPSLPSSSWPCLSSMPASAEFQKNYGGGGAQPPQTSIIHSSQDDIMFSRARAESCASSTTSSASRASAPAPGRYSTTPSTNRAAELRREAVFKRKGSTVAQTPLGFAASYVGSSGSLRHSHERLTSTKRSHEQLAPTKRGRKGPDSEGWLQVESRRNRLADTLDWSRRYAFPSSALSLPSVVIIDADDVAKEKAALRRSVPHDRTQATTSPVPEETNKQMTEIVVPPTAVENSESVPVEEAACASVAESSVEVEEAPSRAFPLEDEISSWKSPSVPPYLSKERHLSSKSNVSSVSSGSSSFPQKRSSMTDTAEALRKHVEKQAKAHSKRERMMEEKSQRARLIERKIDEMKASKERARSESKATLEQKLTRAEEQRRQYLEGIVRKARDEEEKGREIAFINNMEQQCRQAEFQTERQIAEARLAEIQEERQRRLDEKAAKEAAVEERRKNLEAERRRRMSNLMERRRVKEAKVEEERAEREKGRAEAAQERARDHGARLSAIQAAEEAAKEALQKKITLKQEESARRAEEILQEKRKKALMMSVVCYSSSSDDAPLSRRFERPNQCTLCDVMIRSEVNLFSHLKGLSHRDALRAKYGSKVDNIEGLEELNLQHIQEVSTSPTNLLESSENGVGVEAERKRNMRKKARKLKQRMNSRLAKEPPTNLPDMNGISASVQLKTAVKDLKRAIGKGNAVTVGKMCGGLMAEIKTRNDQLLFRNVGGLDILVSVLTHYTEGACALSARSVAECLKLLTAVSNRCEENALYLLETNAFCPVIEYLTDAIEKLADDFKSTGPSWATTQIPVVLTQSLFLFSKSLQSLPQSAFSEQAWMRVQDVVALATSQGLIDVLHHCFMHLGNPIDQSITSTLPLLEFVLCSLATLCTLVSLLHKKTGPNLLLSRASDPSGLIGALRYTEFAGAVDLIYGMLLGHRTLPRRTKDSEPPPILQDALTAAYFLFKLLNSVGELDPKLLQDVLGSECLSLQYRHIVSFLLWYHDKAGGECLKEVIKNVGYFCVQNPANQSIVQFGNQPCVLQQLCNLDDVRYYYELSYTQVLFPTIIACVQGSEENFQLIKREINPSLIYDFLESKMAAEVPLMRLAQVDKKRTGKEGVKGYDEKVLKKRLMLLTSSGSEAED
ncbi:unnamed protein product, partial [Cyprideis torosa]